MMMKNMPNNKIFKVDPEKRRQALEGLIQGASPRRTFFLMMTLSTALATLGLLLGNTPIVVGAMLVAPILSPILCLGMGVVTMDFKLIKFSSISVVKAVILALLISIFISLLVGAHNIENSLISGIEPSYIFIYVALVSGLAGAFAWGHPDLAAALPGVAVSVALIPPLAAVGIGISALDWELIRNSLHVLIINLICIVLISVVVFQLMGYYRERKNAEKAVQKEEKILKQE